MHIPDISVINFQALFPIGEKDGPNSQALPCSIIETSLEGAYLEHDLRAKAKDRPRSTIYANFVVAWTGGLPSPVQTAPFDGPQGDRKRA